MSKKIVVSLIFGGRSAEHEISLVSAAAIHKNLDRTRFGVKSIYITRQGLWRAVDAPSLDIRTLEAGRAFSFLPWGGRGKGPGVAAATSFSILPGPYGAARAT